MFCFIIQPFAKKINIVNKRVFYHGTTDILPITTMILPPVYTGNKREHWRNKHTNYVFFTTSLLSARKFARKASEKYGGNPVVYIVKPIGQYFNTINGEYISEKARVIGQTK